MEKLKETVEALSDDDFHALKVWVATAETRRRADMKVRKAAETDLITDLQDKGKLPKPEAATEDEAVASGAPEWEDPGVYHEKMYHYGDVVRYGDKLVKSTHRGLNHWKPGTLGFDGRIWTVVGTPDAGDDETEEESDPVSDEADVPDFVQPTGAHDTYSLGDRVRYNGQVYESLIDNNAYSPDSYPQGWKQL